MKPIWNKILLIILFLFNYTHAQNSNQTLWDNIIYGDNYYDINYKDIPELSKDSLIFIKSLAFNNNNSFFIYKSKNTDIYYKFIPFTGSLSDVTPKLLYKTISDKARTKLAKSINIYSAVICNRLLKNIYPYLTDLKLYKFTNINGEYLPGYLSIYNKKEEEFLKDTLNTDSFIYLINNNPNIKVDYEEILKFRLIDILLGNINTNPSSYWFIKYKNSITPLVFPKQTAFTLFGGLFYSSAKMLVPGFLRFEENYKSPENLTWKSRYFDRRFLIALNYDSWQKTVSYLQNNLSDSIIINSVYNPYVKLNKETKDLLINGLIKRRNELDKVAKEYYDMLNKYAEVYCTDKQDSVFITRKNNGNVLVSVKSKWLNKFVNYFNKEFDYNITKEIRIFLEEGNDYCSITGSANNSPLIIVNGEGGLDTLIDNSKVKSYTPSFFAITQSDYDTYFFDNSENTCIKQSPYNKSNYKILSNYIAYNEKYDTELKDYGHKWTYFPILEVNTDEGLIIGGGPELTKFNYGILPYSFYLRFTASYATTPKSYKFAFYGDFSDIINNASVIIDATKAELGFDKYFGYGNETEYNKTNDINGFYKTSFELFNFKFGIKHKFKQFSLTYALQYEFGNFTLNNDTLLTNFKYGKYGIGTLWLLGVQLETVYDSRDNIDNPYNGILAKINIKHYPSIVKKLEFPFTKVEGEFRIFNQIRGKYLTVIANRLGGSVVLGKYPFLKGAFIGGKETLRGFNKNRFAGDAAIFSQNEIRTQITDLNLFIKSKLGLLLFSDIGRVFISNKYSNKYHSSAGFGFFINYSDRLFTVVSTFAFSKEKPELFFGTNFNF